MLAYVVLAVTVYGVSFAWMRSGLLRARRQAQEATDRMALAGHEMRTAVGAVAGLCELMRDGVQPPQPEEVERLYAAARCAAELSGGVMDMCSARRMHVKPVTLSLSALLDEVEAVMHAQAAQTGVKLVVQRHGGANWVWGDRVRLRQVLINLTSNALRFTPAGGCVCVGICQREDGQEFFVSDTGAGISPEDRERIFCRYEQGEETAPGDAPDLHAGIGLSICRSAVARMGGTLQVDSQPGRGSRFWFVLKLPEAQPPRENASGRTACKRILLAEDNALSAGITRALLERAGMQVTTVANGQQAVACFCSHEAQAFDAVLLDMHMPVMDGARAAQAIRAAARSRATPVRIVALSGSAEEAGHACALGMDSYFIKPLDVCALIRFLDGGNMSADVEINSEKKPGIVDRRDCE